MKYSGYYSPGAEDCLEYLLPLAGLLPTDSTCEAIVDNAEFGRYTFPVELEQPLPVEGLPTDAEPWILGDTVTVTCVPDERVKTVRLIVYRHFSSLAAVYTIDETGRVDVPIPDDASFVTLKLEQRFALTEHEIRKADESMFFISRTTHTFRRRLSR
ncbi:hypothetical protein GF324_12165 [bacterium]|nr:hypothetical protein [bacterium]